MPYVNFADKQFGVFDNTPTPQDLIGVPFFSTLANYNSGQPINYLGQLYIALSAVTAGAWNPAQWSLVGSASSAVRYDVAQGLSINQMAQGRANIGDLKKNYIINGAMMISQENGTAAGTTSGYYPVEMWTLIYTLSGGAVSVAQVAKTTPAGSSNRIRCTVTTAQPTIGSSSLILDQRIEGVRGADLLLGTANAKTFTVQMGVNAPAGTYNVTIFNPGAVVSTTGTFTVAAGEAGTDVVKSVIFSSGLTTGSFPADNSMCFTLRLYLALSGQFNLLATNGNIFELFDVSLTEGAIAPPFMVPDYVSEFAACQRYYQPGRMTFGIFIAATSFTCNYQIAPVMRAQPTILVKNTGNVINASAAFSISAAAYLVADPGAGSGWINFTTTTSQTVNVTGVCYYGTIAFNARL